MADVDLSVGFDVDADDLDAAIRRQIESIDVSDIMSKNLNMLKEFQSTISAIIRPMTELKDVVKEMGSIFKEASQAATSVRESVASTRLHAGLGGASSGGVSGGGSVLSSIFPGVGTMLSPLGMLGLQGAAVGTTGLAGAGIGSLLSDPFQRLLGRLGIRAFQPEAETTTLRGVGRQTGILGRLAQGQDLQEVMKEATPGEIASVYGMFRGLSSIGSGPVGMASQFVGGAFGAARGQFVGGNMAEQFGLSRLVGQGIGAEMGRSLVAGQLEHTITEGMQRYPGYLSTMAGMAGPAQYGADVRMLRGLRPAQFGIGPEQFGSEFGALYQGFGGGPLTRDTVRTSMAYMRRYGVGMGEQGQAAAGLLQLGGTAEAPPEQREQTLFRIMTDAVSTGFGRRLPEFAQSVQAGVRVAMSGPGVLTTEETQALIGEMSTMTAGVMRQRGVGLEGAQRIISPFAGAPGGMIRGLMGGGDPWTMGLLSSTNMRRFGGDPYEMLFSKGGLADAQARPFDEGLEFMGPMVKSLLQSSSTRMGGFYSISNMFKGMGVEPELRTVQRIVEEGGGLMQRARAEGREVTDEEMVELLRDVAGVQEAGAASVQDTIERVNIEGREIMNSQLGALRTLASHQETQLAISAAMAPIASKFYNDQLTETRTMAELLRTSALANTLGELSSMRQKGAAILQGQGPEDFMNFMLENLFRQAQDMGPGFDLPEPSQEQAATQREFKESVRGLARGLSFSDVVRSIEPTTPEQATNIVPWDPRPQKTPHQNAVPGSTIPRPDLPVVDMPDSMRRGRPQITPERRPDPRQSWMIISRQLAASRSV